MRKAWYRSLPIIVAVATAMACPAICAPPAQDGDDTTEPARDDGLGDLIHHQQEEQARSKRWLLISEFGNPPPMITIDVLTDRRMLEYRATELRYAQQMEGLGRKYFRTKRNAEAWKEGLSELREFTDPAAFRPMIEEFAEADDDLRLAVLDFFNEHGDEGQAALAWTAIYSTDSALRNEAQKRMVVPASDPVKLEIEMALRSGENKAITHAGTLAGALNVVEAIPLLIYTQASTGPGGGGGGNRNQGDLAWIAIQTQHAYVQDLQPVVGDASGAFAPVLGVISEGSVLRIVDAVAIIYRTEIHYVLRGLASRAYGEAPDLGYDPHAWTDWYNSQFVPYMNEQADIEDLADQNDDRNSGDG